MVAIRSFVGAMLHTFASGTSPSVTVPTGPFTSDTIREHPIALYALLRSLKRNNEPYDEALRVGTDLGLKFGSAKGLRNPVNAVCEFYPVVIWPGSLPDALPIETPERRANRRNRTLSAPGSPTVAEASDRLEAAIHRGWAMSNWGSRKQVFARNLPTLGDQYLKIAFNEERSRAFFQIIDPEHVTDLDTDERGFLTYIRIDVPRKRKSIGNLSEMYLFTEIWDKELGTYRTWEHKHFSADPEDVGVLGEPKTEEDIKKQHGDDYVPFVHCKHKDDGGERGVAAVMEALDKIVYGDLLVTALHQRLTNHNRPDRVLVGVGTDSDGIPLSPPRKEDLVTLDVDGEAEYALPAGWRFEPYVAQLDYQSHLNVVEAHYESLFHTDLIEMTWYKVIDNAAASGRARHYQLTPALKKADEVRGNAEYALIRANQMLMTAAQFAGMPGFSANEIGTYANGDFEHWFEDRGILPPAVEEELELAVKRSQMTKTYTDAGASLRGAAQAAGVDDEDVEALVSVDVDVVEP